MKQAQTAPGAAPEHSVITNTGALAGFCERLKGDAFVAVDTEFMRERTYYPELCLVQVAGSEARAAIDPLAPGIDLAPFYALLADTNVLKVFHACRQDMEIFHQHMGELPKPIFDTQVAAMVLGYGESASYESLVGRVVGAKVDKSSRFTDWGKRPLSPKQIDYAMHDVIYLRQVYAALAEKLAKSGRASWIEEEMAPLRDPKTYEVDPEEAWRRLRLRQTSPRALANLQAAARWREITARERNVPRGRVMKDEALAEVAQSRPADFAGLQAIRGFYPTMQAPQYQPLFAALAAVDAMPASEYPRLGRKDPLPEGAEAIVDLLRLLLKACAEKERVVARLIADKEELEALASGARENVHALTGWRHEVFGNKAIELLSGRVAIKADGKNGIAFVSVA